MRLRPGGGGLDVKLLEILSREGIEPALEATDKLGVLRELSRLVARVDGSINPDHLTEILMERERLGSTGIGSGVAIPHGKSREVARTLVVFGRSVEGIEFDAVDDQPCHLFFLLVAPAASTAGLHLKALARITRLMREADFRNRLMDAASEDVLWEAFRVEDERV